MAVLPTESLRRALRVGSPLWRNALAEVFSTFLLCFCGLANVAQLILTQEKVFTFVQINVGWGLTIALCVYITARLSGGHMNPAVSLLFWTFGEITLVQLLVYTVAQTVGAFLGAAATYGVYYDAINAFEKGLRTVTGPHATAGIFGTFPKSWLTFRGAFWDQVAGTGILALFAAGLTDRRNNIPHSAVPALFGGLVVMIGTSFAFNCGYPINPARDFGPRLFSFFIYGDEVFSYPYGYYWLAPILGPCVGAVLGGWLYHIFLGAHVPDPESPLIIRNNGDSHNQEETIKLSSSH